MILFSCDGNWKETSLNYAHVNYLMPHYSIYWVTVFWVNIMSRKPYSFITTVRKRRSGGLRLWALKCHSSITKSGDWLISWFEKQQQNTKLFCHVPCTKRPQKGSLQGLWDVSNRNISSELFMHLLDFLRLSLFSLLLKSNFTSVM